MVDSKDVPLIILIGVSKESESRLQDQWDVLDFDSLHICIYFVQFSDTVFSGN